MSVTILLRSRRQSCALSRSHGRHRIETRSPSLRAWGVDGSPSSMLSSEYDAQRGFGTGRAMDYTREVCADVGSDTERVDGLLSSLLVVRMEGVGDGTA